MNGEKELRDSVEWYKTNEYYKPLQHHGHLTALLALAEAYQKVGEGLPEKKDDPTKFNHHPDYLCEIYNQAIDDCRLAYTKKLMSGGLEDAIVKALQDDVCCEIPELATAIRTYLTNHIVDVNKMGDDYKDKYFELIMAVGNKYANETRHETALRYIVDAEKEKTNMGGYQCDLTNHSEEKEVLSSQYRGGMLTIREDKHGQDI